MSFSHHFDRVITVELSAEKIAMAQNNAKVYGCRDNVTWVHGDFLQLVRDGSIARLLNGMQ